MLNKALFRLQPATYLNRSLLLRSSAVSRAFSANVSVMNDADQQGEVESAEARWARLGVDQKFDAQKHAYVLTFPWNFPEIVDTFEATHQPMSDDKWWARYMEDSRAIVDFNILFR